MTKKNLIIIALVLLIIIAARPVGELNGITKKTKRFQEENPYGMVFVKRGSFIMGANDQSAIGSLSDKSINVTVDAFWMDATEITNNEYKQFVHWVRDSIAMRMLINSNALGYQKLTTYNNRENPLDNLSPEELAKVPLNWKAKIPWSSKDDTVKAVLGRFYFFSENAIGRSNQMNPAILTYKYEWINYDQAGLPGNKYNVATGAYPKNAKVRVDTSYVDENGVIVNRTIERKLVNRKDLISTRIVNVYPDTVMWLRDFQYAYNDPKMKMYFSHPGFAQYPVVGVTWEQAQAFCNWRTQLYNTTHKVGGQDYRLPTEAEWEYAARGGKQLGLYPWGGNYLRDNNGCFLANFKPMRGSYTDDTGATTMKVRSCAPNEYGLYDKAGNVAEWTRSDYLPYPYKEKLQGTGDRKVVRGGSYIDHPKHAIAAARKAFYPWQSVFNVGVRLIIED